MAAENFKVKKGLEVGTAITATGSGIDVTGIITATQFKGDGSGLTNVVGSGSGVVIKDEGSAVGTAGTINFVGSGVVAAIGGGTATVTISSGGLSDVVGDTTPQLGGNLDLNGKFINGTGGANITGVVTATTFVGNGDFVDLDVDGHTELDDLNVSGITTSALLDVGNLTNGRVAYVGSTSGRLVDSANLTFDGTSLFVSGINVVSGGTTSTFGADTVTRNLNVTGVSTFGGVVNISNIRLQTGTNQDLIQTTSTFGLVLENSNSITLKQRSHPNWTYASFAAGGVTLHHNNQTRLTTTASGITVPDLHATGVGTFATRIDTNGISLGTNNNNFAAKFVDNAVANFGTDNDLKISHNNTDAIFENTTGQFVFKDTAGEAEFKIQGHESSAASLFLFADEGDDPNDRWKATAHTDGNLVLNYFRGATNAYAKVAQFTTDAGTQLFHTAVKKFETTGHGVVVSGVCTATSFNGDGSGLTGVTASGTGIIVQHDGSNVGTAGTINFSTNLDVTPIHAGIVTVTAASSTTVDKIEEGNSKVEVVDTGSGYATFDIDGTESMRVTSGGATIRYLSVGENQNMGNSSGTGLTLGDGGNNSDIIASSAGNGLDIQSNNGVSIGQRGFPNYDYASFNNTYGIFRTNNVQRFRYDSSGIVVGPISGIGATIRVDGSAIFAGIVTATTFSGALAASNLTGALPAISGANLTSLNADELDSGTIPNGRFPATLPASSGANLTALNADNISSGTLASARIEDEAITFPKMQHVGTGVLLGRNDSGTGDIETLTASEVRTLLNVSDGATAGITTSSSNVVATWDVVNSSASAYVFTGPGQSSSSNPDIYLVRGLKYRFAVNASGHPFFIKTSATTGTSNQYTDGVTGNGTQSGNVEFYVPNDAPARLYYICQYHGGMVGNLYILGGIQTGITSTRFTGQVDVTNVLNVTSDLNITNGIIRRDNKLWLQAGGDPTYYAGTPSGAAGDHVFKTFAGGFSSEQCRINLSGVNITGVCTATHFYGNGANLTNLPAATNVNLTAKNDSLVYRVPFASANTGSAQLYSDGDITFRPDNGTLTATTFVGALTGTASGNPTLTSGANNRVVTATGANALTGESALTFDGSTLSIGAGTAAPLLISRGTVSSSSSSVTVNTTAVGSCSAIEYTIFVSNSTNIQSQKVLVMDNGTTAYIQEFAVMSNPNLIVTFTADVNSGNVRLIATKESGISGSVSYKFSKMIIQ